MGLFSRKDPSDDKRQRAAARPSVSSEAQARELRVRARRRLIGALALVLAAVIIVPMLSDSGVPEDEVSTPVVVPSIVAPSPDAPLIATRPDVAQSPSAGSVIVDESDTASPPSATASPSSSAESSSSTQASTSAERVTPPVSGSQSSQSSAPKPSEPSVAMAKPAKPAEKRTDDGSVALALLEGRAPVHPPASQQKGNFILQIAAYTSEQDALARRDRLREAGVTNAYVETANAGGKTTHRLRVGPFPTREAAVAAQTRVRALGYDNGFIASK